MSTSFLQRLLEVCTCRHGEAYLVDPAGFPASLSAGLSGLALHSEQHKLGMRLSHTR